MSMNAPASSAGSVGEWISEHPGISVAGLLILLFVGYTLIQKSKTQTPGSTASTLNAGVGSTADTSGLQTDASGNKIVYVPTTTNFVTRNTTTGSNVNSPNASTATTSVSAPIATSVSAAAPVASSVSTTTSSTIAPVVVSTAPPPITVPAINNVPTRVPTPAPSVVHKGALVWDQHYSVKSGDNLSGIASKLTQSLRTMGMPGGLSVTYNDIYAHNQSVINGMAAQHGIHASQVNYVYPNESLTVPHWDKNAG